MKFIVEIKTEVGGIRTGTYLPLEKRTVSQSDIFEALVEKLAKKGFKIETLSIEEYSEKFADSGDE